MRFNPRSFVEQQEQMFLGFHIRFGSNGLMERAKHSRSLYGCTGVLCTSKWCFMGWGLVSEHDPLDCAPAQEVEEVEELPSGTAL